MKDLLAGQILWVTSNQLILTALLYLPLLAIWFVLKDKSGRAGLNAAFATAVTISVQLVGVYLVFATLIMPGLASMRHKGHKQLLYAYGIGVLGVGVGLIFSARLDTATGPTIVCSLALTSLLARVVLGTNIKAS